MADAGENRGGIGVQESAADSARDLQQYAHENTRENTCANGSLIAATMRERLRR